MRYFFGILSFFLLATIAWGILFGLWLGLYVGIRKGILYGIEGGLIVSFIITIIGASYDFLTRRVVFKKYGIKSFELTQMREMLFTGHIKDIFQLSLEALKKIPKIKKVSPDFMANKIWATTSWSWRTFGEVIEVGLNQEEDRVKVLILSKPRLRTAIFDCGKNIENVEIFCYSLNRGQT